MSYRSSGRRTHEPLAEVDGIDRTESRGDDGACYYWGVRDLVALGRCDINTFSKFIRPTTSGASQTTIDLRRIGFCDPWALVAIAAFADAALLQGRNVDLIAPSDDSSANYLSRMRLGKALGALGVSHNLPAVNEKPMRSQLVELTQFQHNGPEELAKMVFDELEDVSPAVAHALHVGIAEAGENVIKHSGRGHGFAAAQKWNNGTKLLFAVSDSGSGLLRNLQSPLVTTDEHAIQEALKRRATSSRGKRGGLGLASILRQTQQLSGSLQIASGFAHLHHEQGTSRVRTVGHRIEGTILQGSVRL